MTVITYFLIRVIRYVSKNLIISNKIYTRLSVNPGSSFTSYSGLRQYSSTDKYLCRDLIFNLGKKFLGEGKVYLYLTNREVFEKYNAKSIDDKIT